MKTTVEVKQVADLIRLFGAMEKLQTKMLELVGEKIDAMKRADLAGLHRLREQERALVERIREREGLRCQLLDLIGRGLGLPAPAGRALSVSQLAERIPLSEKKNFMDAALRLRSVVFHLAHANRLAGVISREVLNHVRWVFASVRPAESPTSGYAVDGARKSEPDARILEAVG